MTHIILGSLRGIRPTELTEPYSILLLLGLPCCGTGRLGVPKAGRTIAGRGGVLTLPTSQHGGGGG